MNVQPDGGCAGEAVRDHHQWRSRLNYDDNSIYGPMPKPNGETSRGRFMRVPALDPRRGNNFIDANAFDLTGGPGDAAVKEILRLRDEGAFTLDIPHSVKSEIGHRHTPANVKRETAHMIYTMPTQLTGPEKMTLNEVKALIQGNARPGQHDKDALHLFESAKYGGRFFITNDARLLKKAGEIWKLLRPLTVVTPREFLAAYWARADACYGFIS